MRNIFIILLGVAIAYFSWNAYKQHQVEQVVRTPEPTKAFRTVLHPEAEHIVCPTCNGEGRLMKWTNKRNVPYPCPICNGTGYRNLTIPKGRKLCPDCRGMGRVFKPGVKFGTGNKPATTPCRRCATSGMVQDAR